MALIGRNNGQVGLSDNNRGRLSSEPFPPPFYPKFQGFIREEGTSTHTIQSIDPEHSTVLYCMSRASRELRNQYLLVLRGLRNRCRDISARVIIAWKALAKILAEHAGRADFSTPHPAQGPISELSGFLRLYPPAMGTSPFPPLFDSL